MKNVQLDNDQLERLLDAMNDDLSDVKAGLLVGFPQSVADEVADLEALITVLRVARWGPE